MPNEQDISEQQDLLATHRRTLSIYLHQQALQGSARASAEVVNGIRTTREHIAHCKTVLRSWGLPVEDLPDDYPTGVQQRQLFLLNTRQLSSYKLLAVVVLAAIVLFVALNMRLGANNILEGSHNLGNVQNTGSIGQLTINNGDSPEVRRQKRDQAKQLVVKDVLANIVHIEARLAIVATALRPVPDPLAVSRQTVAPRSEELAQAGYNRLIAGKRAEDLQQSFNGRPLRLEFDGPLVQVLIDSSTDVANVRDFYDLLATTDDASETLLQTLREAAKYADGTDRYMDQRVELARDVLHNRSQAVYLQGLMALRDMGATPADLTVLQDLRELVPNQMPSQTHLEELISTNEYEAKLLNERSNALIAAGQQIVATEVSEYQNALKELEIQPTDTWEQVSYKARSLRDLGQIDQSVAAYARYGEMFSDDPNAAQFSRTAQAFTRQMVTLAVSGGVYIFDVQESSSANTAGIAVGDILIAYNGQPIKGMTHMMELLQTKPTDGRLVMIEWLRLDSAGTWIRFQAEVPAGTLGIWMMPI